MKTFVKQTPEGTKSATVLQVREARPIVSSEAMDGLADDHWLVLWNENGRASLTVALNERNARWLVQVEGYVPNS